VGRLTRPSLNLLIGHAHDGGFACPHYGMTYDGGNNGNGVVYQFDLGSLQYTVLHTFSALDAKGNNKDGANPGVALTRGPDDVIYGMASFGGENGNGTIFKITTSGDFTGNDQDHFYWGAVQSVQEFFVSQTFPPWCRPPASNHHNGYTSGREDCPFRVEAMPALPSSVIFPRPSIRAWPPWYRKG
jgi:uncharacterized repeat protein (TIGR03803 family)